MFVGVDVEICPVPLKHGESRFRSRAAHTHSLIGDYVQFVETVFGGDYRAVSDMRIASLLEEELLEIS